MDGIQKHRRNTALSRFFGAGLPGFFLLAQLLLTFAPASPGPVGAALFAALAAVPSVSRADCDGEDDGDDDCPNPGKSNGGNSPDTNRPCTPHCGDPIDLTTGNVYETEADYVGAGPFPLKLVRYYNSQSTLAAGAFGANWSHQFGGPLQLLPTADAPTTVKVPRPGGKVITFTWSPSAQAWTTDADVNARLERAYVPFAAGQPMAGSDGIRAGWHYLTGEDNIEAYEPFGKLVSVTNRVGLAQTFAYDLTGRLASVTDPFGRTLSFAYAGWDGRIASATDPAGGVYAYAYDANNNLVSVTYPDGKVRRYVYENTGFSHALTGLVDENGVRFSTWAYDAKGLAVSSEHAGGLDKTAVGYVFPADTTFTSTARSSDALGNTWNYSFAISHGLSRPLLTTQPTDAGSAAHTAAWEYDANGNASQYTDYNGNITTYGYDLAHNLETSRTEASGTPQARTVTTEWHANFRLPVKVTEPGRATTFAYDANGNLTTRTVAAGGLARTWNYTYNANGQVVQIDGPRTDASDLTQFSYDAKGNLASITDALGHVTQITAYDANGRPLAINDPNGLVVKLAYDKRGRLLSRNVGGETTVYAYDAAGQLKKITRPDASFTAFAYDPAHRLIQVSDNLGDKIVYTLDAVGNRTQAQVYDPANHLARTLGQAFDALNRLQAAVGAQGQTTTFGYDGNGNLVTASDPLGNVTNRDYDALDRLAASIDPLSGKTQYGYDANGNLGKVVDPRGLATRYAYDGLGNRTQTASPDTGTAVDTFDAAGNRLTATDARGKKTIFNYDALNRPLGQSFASGTPVAFSYDSGTYGLGRLTGMADETGSTSWSYDLHGRVVQKTQTVRATVQQLGYAYDAAGRLAQIAYPSGNAVGIGYDAAGRPAQLTLGGQTILGNIQYTAFGAVKSWVWGNGQAYQCGFDLDGRLVSYPLGGGRANSLAYDAAGRVTAYNDGQWQFQYDATGRLDSAQQGFDNLTSYAYDPDGNRTSQTLLPLMQTSQTAATAQTTHYTYDTASNRLLNVQGGANHAYAYDAAGNTLGDGALLYGYSDRGRLAQIGSAAGPPRVALAQFGVNGLGQRVWKISSAGTVLFVYDEAGRLLGDYGTDGIPLRETVWLGGLPVAVVVGGKAYPVYADHLGAPRAVADPTSKVVWRWDGGPFGEGLPDEDPDGDGVRFVYNLRFPGQYYDAETGNYYNYFRDYSPAIGRYLQSDPVGLEGGVNTYAYANGSPTTKIDPLGLATFMCMNPLHALGGDGLRSGPDIPGNPLYHQYVCVPGANGQMQCGGQDRADGAFGPGKPSDDNFKPKNCEKVEDDNKCVEQCVLSAVDNPRRPPYWVVGGGTSRLGGEVPGIGMNCQEWADYQVRRCVSQCRKK